MKTAVVSAINGDADVPLCKALGHQGVTATDIAVVALCGRGMIDAAAAGQAPLGACEA
jgi:Periplasmic binding protein domain